ncbi:ABC transporter C family protein (macronuclear) [Tetrahymena thermophila SB210]|uniref:ABC transporter C family protein n=1 Tax=Tetrahymena thermophila (strain SB210) TaxID=312017 RepID=I7LVZ2_TETTS|nr:ABC transporter C family protein [Tetrahymena thermophila SB210]EAS00380.2 ABC transporter C family protein [Tetrahymena thermophila SB210]|eukprot:XP_001020625.2 ABC transporter C family protein [Tetrahymena thermophila SB210]
MGKKNKNEINEKLLPEQSEANIIVNQDEENPVQIKQKKPYKTRYQRASIFSKIFFWWAIPLVRLGNRIHLEQEHLDQLAEDQKSSFYFNRFKKNFEKYSEMKSNQVLTRSLITTFRSRIIISFVITFFDSCVLMSTPYLIKTVIEYSSEKNQDYRIGIILICAVVLSRIILCILDSHSNYQFSTLGFDLTNTVSVALLEKSLRYSLLSTDDYKVGSLVNMIQVDGQRLQFLFNQFSSICFLPLQLGFGIYLMSDIIGISFLFGVGVMLLMGFINFLIGRFSLKYQKLFMKEKDDRMKITTEVFNAIKFIKANAWEEYFYDKLDLKRQKELSLVAKKFICGSMSIFSLWITPMLIINATFAGYVLLGNQMTPVKAFTIISIFSVLQEPIRSLPVIISNLIETYVSIKRMEKYLGQQDINKKFLKHNLEDSSDTFYALKITNGNFYWRTPQIKNEIENQQESQQNENISEQNKGYYSSFIPVQESDQDEKDLQRNNQNKQPNQQKEINKDSVVDKDSYISQKNNSTIIFNDKIQDSNQNQQQNPQNPGSESKQQIESPLQTNKEQNDFHILKNINITIPKGKFVAIIGDVGCGKSSLLQSIIGEMKYDEQNEFNMPQVEINGDISLVNQKPWILNATVKDNIVFGFPFDEEKYEQCVKYACLKSDFKVLADGDQTQIGEKGVNLSGGQKARVSLARSLYSNSSILLLDDILSAVDVHVGRYIVQECLLKYKKNTTRILATHALHYLKYMDYVYFMKDGRITLEGEYQYIQETAEFKYIYEKFMKDQFEKEEDSDKKDDIIFSDEDISPKNEKDNHQQQKNNKLQQNQHQSTNESEEEQQSLVQNPKKSITLKGKKNGSIIKEEDPEEIETDEVYKDYLMLKEDRKKGKIQWKVVKQYLKNNGGFFFILGALISMTLWQGLKMASSIWISYWTEDEDESKNNFYLTGYSIFSISYGFFAMIRALFCLFGSLKEARIIHRNIISSLIFAPLNEFFERVPIGRVLNILSKDLSVIDQEVGYNIGGLSVSFFSLIGDTALCVYSSSLYVLIPIFLFVVICRILQMYYMNSQREVVRLETLTRSPIISYFTEALNGLSSIRAFKQEDRFFQKHCKNIDENKKCQFSFIGMESWFKQNLTFLSLIVNSASISFCLFWNKQNPSVTGLLLTFAFSIDNTVKFLIGNWNNLEKNFVSIERCHQFSEIQTEKGYDSYLQNRQQYKEQLINPLPEDQDKLYHWPQEGKIIIDDLYLKYRPNLPCVIKGITTQIKPCEKIGVVGRTGAGKSTITLSLLRIIEAFKGKITIDGVDISQIRLDQLRHKITIILQDPILFDGTLRDNIDPLNRFKDEEIIQTLEKCQLSKLTQSEKGLNTYINEGGDNLSVGEKQLVCIARALLKKSKIVLIDEATANIDIQTDHLIQQTISNVFKDCTVLTIAHRLNTILNSDRILVLSQGRIEEFDSPANLIKNPNSHFYSLYQESVKENKI